MFAGSAYTASALTMICFLNLGVKVGCHNGGEENLRSNLCRALSVEQSRPSRAQDVPESIGIASPENLRDRVKQVRAEASRSKKKVNC